MSRSMGFGSASTALGCLAAFCAMAGSTSGGHLFGFLGPFDAWSWNYAIPWMIASLVFTGLATGAAQIRIAARQEQENANAKDFTRPYILRCRPFSADNNILIDNPEISPLGLIFPSNHYESLCISLERLIAQSVQPEFQLQVMGGDPTGPGIVRSVDSGWREEFQQRIVSAVGILIVALPGKEIPWEVDKIRHAGLLARTVFLIPPKVREEKSSVLAFNTLMKERGFDLPTPEAKTILLQFDNSIKIVKQTKLGKLSYQSLRGALQEFSILQQEGNAPIRRCCGNCQYFERNGLVALTKGYCQHHQKKCMRIRTARATNGQRVMSGALHNRKRLPTILFPPSRHHISKFTRKYGVRHEC